MAYSELPWRPFLGHQAWSWTILRRGNFFVTFTDVFFKFLSRFYVFNVFKIVIWTYFLHLWRGTRPPYALGRPPPSQMLWFASPASSFWRPLSWLIQAAVPLPQSCPWIHFVWTDPTQPISWLTQPDPTQPNPWTTLLCPDCAGRLDPPAAAAPFHWQSCGTYEQNGAKNVIPLGSG